MNANDLPGYDDWLVSGYDERDPDVCPNCGDEDCDGCDVDLGPRYGDAPDILTEDDL